MSSKYFAKKDSFAEAVIILWYAMMIFTACFVVYRFPDVLPVVFMILLFWSCLTVVLIKHAKSCGLYIRGDKIYYKDILSLESKIIDPNKIKGIKTVRAEKPHCRYNLSGHLKTVKGKYLYTMILTDEINDDMFLSNYGDISFCRKFKKHILCCVTYNEALMNELLRLNPNIEIIRHRYAGKIKPNGERIPGRI